jgi:predicted nucleic acid-binding protein
LRLHLDTSFLVDWQRNDSRIAALRRDMIDGFHQVSFDPVVEAEFFAVRRITRELLAVYTSVAAIGERVDISSAAARLAALWLSPMDEPQRKAHFADAIVASVATTEEAILVTGDALLARVFPAAVLLY